MFVFLLTLSITTGWLAITSYDSILHKITLSVSAT